MGSGDSYGPGFRLFRRLEAAADVLFQGLRHVRLLEPGSLVSLLQSIPGGTIEAEPEEVIVGSAAPDCNRELLRSLWLGALAGEGSVEGRHRLANVIGPALLLPATSGECGVRIADRGVEALGQLLRALGALPPLGVPAVSAARLDGMRREWTKRGCRALLVDDMHDAGWRDVVNTALGNPDNPPMAGGDAAFLEAFVDEQLAEGPHLRIGKGLQPSEQIGSEACNVVLFLDLRLFQPEQRAGEADFVRRKLLPLAEKAVDGVSLDSPMAWPGFRAEEIAEIREWLGNPAHDDHPGRVLSLTLLPRLVALVDPFLPIVLFSSSGNRRAVTPLMPYGTIITEFEKPRLWGVDPSHIVDESLAGFARAVERALFLLRARRLCRGIVSTAARCPPAVRRPREGAGHYELYIDESGSGAAVDSQHLQGRAGKQFVVGGLLVPYKDEAEAEGFSGKLRRLESKTGTRLMIALSLQHEARRTGGEPVKDEAKQISELFQLFANTLGERETTSSGPPVGVTLAFDRPMSHFDDEVLAEGWADNRHSQMVSGIIELALFVLLPRMAPGSKSIGTLIFGDSGAEGCWWAQTA